MEEFEAVKKIMDVMSKNWKRLSPDTKLWLKGQLEKLETGKVVKSDTDRERV